eukprot:TRINITY_DN4099_c0_g1_i1.p1 TRINITY_DN4099_c0_g1~~TRINITY_DN4099_c0_g1_i1.p1  ORF type:complete len:383 (-),score=100.30 TRINITY_DN4099_c0_g1_i1:243-1274(-)
MAMSSSSSCDRSPSADASSAAGDDQKNVRCLSQLSKTRLCTYFARGMCRNGETCTFAHGSTELSIKPDLRKTSLCKDWERGTCRKLAFQCNFAHGYREIRVTEAFAPMQKAPTSRRRVKQLDELQQPQQQQQPPPAMELQAERVSPPAAAACAAAAVEAAAAGMVGDVSSALCDMDTPMPLAVLPGKLSGAMYTFGSLSEDSEDVSNAAATTPCESGGGFVGLPLTAPPRQLLEEAEEDEEDEADGQPRLTLHLQQLVDRQNSLPLWGNSEKTDDCEAATAKTSAGSTPDSSCCTTRSSLSTTVSTPFVMPVLSPQHIVQLVRKAPGVYEEMLLRAMPEVYED